MCLSETECAQVHIAVRHSGDNSVVEMKFLLNAQIYSSLLTMDFASHVMVLYHENFCGSSRAKGICFWFCKSNNTPSITYVLSPPFDF